MLVRRRNKLGHSVNKRLRGRHAQLEVDAGVGAVVARAEHERVDLRHGRDLVEVLQALDALDLRDDADVLVGALHVPVVARVERLVGDAGGESPGAEGALAEGRWGSLAHNQWQAGS